MPGMHVRFGVTPEEFLGYLTEAAYRSVLKHGFKASFIDVAMDIEGALQLVMDRDIQVSEACGSQDCMARTAGSFEVWSNPAKNLFCGK